MYMHAWVLHLLKFAHIGYTTMATRVGIHDKSMPSTAATSKSRNYNN